MNEKAIATDPLDDGWKDSTDACPPRVMTDLRHVSIMLTGDTVLFRLNGRVSPAVLVEPAGEDCWLARSARGMIYLSEANIISCLPRTDLLGEAA